ncbi:MAG: hypothetical protein R2932_14720 [Caldilineaceae bacterium]
MQTHIHQPIYSRRRRPWSFYSNICVIVVLTLLSVLRPLPAAAQAAPVGYP